ncbi:SRPBCC family protein [Dongia sp.]|uniref:SRPBCC family protein n=1 Tax=Dongia sp. TaxID=1977262 RepID=UPI0035B071ED
MTVRLMRSAVIDAPAADVWHLLRDFNGHDKWHPAVASSQIEAGEPGDLVGGIRAFRLQDGGYLREQLLSLSDRDMAFSYCLLEAPMPLNDYVAHLRLRPVTDGNRCLITWESHFEPPPAQAQSLTQLVATAIYEAGITALQAHFGGARPRMPQAIHVPPVRPIAPSSPPVGSAAALRTRGIMVRAYGGPEVLEPVEIDVPPPAAGEIRLRHDAIGVNFLDLHCRAGDFPMLALPGVPGVEGAGVITEIGAGVTDLRPGKRVVYAGMPLGAYAGHRLLPAEIAIPLPDDIDAPVAAATFLKGLMADALLHDVHPLRSGERIFIRAAAGGVGMILAQMARAAGAHVIGAVSSTDKVAAAREAGCHEIVVTRGDDGMRDLCQTIDAVFDGIGRDTYEESLTLLAPRGHLIVYGQSSGPLGPRNLDALADNALTLSRPNLAHYMASRREIEERARRLFDFIRRGVIAPRITTFTLADAAAAHRQLATGANIGSIVLVP